MLGTLKKALAGDIAKLVDTGYMDFFSGMEEGAVYNGKWRGGIATTVRYTRKMGREGIIHNPV